MVYNPVTGVLETHGGKFYSALSARATEFHASVNLHRRRIGDQVCGVAGREIQNDGGMHHTNGNVALNFGQALPPFGIDGGLPTDVNIGSLNLNQHARWALGGNFNGRIAHGQVLHDAPLSWTQARTFAKITNNDLLGGAVSQDQNVGIIGNQYYRNEEQAEMRADIKSRHMQAYPVFRYLNHPNFQDEISLVWFNMKSDITPVNSPTNRFVHWIQLTGQHGMVYNFGSGQQSLAPLADSNATFSNVNGGWMWQPVNPGTTTGRGRGVIIVGTNNLFFDCEGQRIACGIDLGNNPVGQGSIFIDVAGITLADIQELHDNLGTYFSWINSADVQGATWRPAGKSSVAIWGANQSYTLEDGNTVTVDSPACLTIAENGQDYDLAIGDALWRNFPAPGMGGSQRGVNISITNKPATYQEWAIYNHTTERGSPTVAKPPGPYYWGAESYVTI